MSPKQHHVADEPITEAELLKVFQGFDQNGDGTIDEFELLDALRSLWLGQSVLTPSEISELFRVADADGDGQINFAEFSAMLGGMDEDAVEGGSPQEAEITAAFHQFDVNGDGRIDADELRQALTVLSGGMQPPTAGEVNTFTPYIHTNQST